MSSVHVTDNTKYWISVLDGTTPFDPSDAITKEIIFHMPGGVTITKPANVETWPEKYPGEHFLTYTVEDSSDFYAARSGLMKMKFRLAWINTSFTSALVSVDEKGNEMRIRK